MKTQYGKPFKFFKKRERRLNKDDRRKLNGLQIKSMAFCGNLLALCAR